MPHLDPDRLVILALGESTADATESVHLVDCTGCQTEIDSLRHVAGLSAETQDLRDLPPPPDRVWQGIAAEVAGSRPATTAPDRRMAALPTGVRSRTAPGRNTPRWLTPVLAAAAAAVVAIAGTVSVIRLAERPAVTARAALSPLDGAPANAGGRAEVLGGAELAVKVQEMPLTTGYYEIWVINPDNPKDMRSLGNMGRTSTAVFPIPPTFDLNRYRLVDISAEANDGDTAHSGKSMLRGTLTS